MSNVYVLQTENRLELDYFLLSQKVNKKMCDIFNYNYVFVLNDDNKYKDLHPATKKIYIINDFLINHNHNDILVFLDSDAWIQNVYLLNEIINNLGDKNGSYSRDPYLKKNTYINSGSFILKVNDFTKNMYQEIINSLENNNEFWNKWSYDQHYISNFVFDNKENFNIYLPNILNTPIGIVLRHDWFKTQMMYSELNKLLNNNIPQLTFINHNFYDNEPYPNINEDDIIIA